MRKRKRPPAAWGSHKFVRKFLSGWILPLHFLVNRMQVGNQEGSQVSRVLIKHVGGERDSGGGDRAGEGPGEEGKRVRRRGCE